MLVRKLLMLAQSGDILRGKTKIRVGYRSRRRRRGGR